MNLNAYIEKFADLSLSEMPFSEVDALIFAELAFANFEVLAPVFLGDEKPLRIDSIDKEMLKILCREEFIAYQLKKLIPRVGKSKRFANLTVSDVAYEMREDVVMQFCAMTFHINNNLHFIAFRGTDLTTVGWREDFNMSFLEAIPSHLSAKKYADAIFKKYPGSFYIGGHSKGGNLTFYAASMLSDKNQNRLVNAFSFDGPGFRNKDFFKKDCFENYAHSKKYIKIVPKDDVVGIIMNSHKIAKIVDSNTIWILQHDPFSWIINPNGTFKYMKRRTATSYIFESGFNSWLSTMNEEESKFSCNALFDLFAGSNKTLEDIFFAIPTLALESTTKLKQYSKKDREFAKKSFINLNKCFIKATKDYYNNNKKKSEVR